MCDEDVARRVHEELAGRATDEVLRKPAAAVSPQSEEVRPEALDGVTDDAMRASSTDLGGKPRSITDIRDPVALCGKARGA
jgi:hypothetical protein